MTSGPVGLPIPPSAPHSPIASARFSREHRVDHRQRRREAARGGDPLQRAPHEDLGPGAGDRADRRRQRVPDDSDEQERARTDAVGHATHEHERRREAERGDRHDRAERSDRDADVGPSAGGARRRR